MPPVIAPSLLEPNRARTAQPEWQLARFPSRLAFHRFHGLGSPRRWTRSDSGHRRPPLYPLRRWRGQRTGRGLSWIEKRPGGGLPKQRRVSSIRRQVPLLRSHRPQLAPRLNRNAPTQTADFSEKSTGIQPGKSKTSTNRKTLRRWPNKKPLTCFCRRRHKTPSIWKRKPRP